MSGELKTLIAKQENIYAIIQKIKTNFRKLPGTKLTEGYVTTSKENLEKHWKQFLEIHWSIIRQANPKDRETFNYFKKDVHFECEELYIELKSDIIDMVEDLIETTETLKIPENDKEEPDQSQEREVEVRDIQEREVEKKKNTNERKITQRETYERQNKESKKRNESDQYKELKGDVILGEKSITSRHVSRESQIQELQREAAGKRKTEKMYEKTNREKEMYDTAKCSTRNNLPNKNMKIIFGHRRSNKKISNNFLQDEQNTLKIMQYSRIFRYFKILDSSPDRKKRKKRLETDENAHTRGRVKMKQFMEKQCLDESSKFPLMYSC